MTVEELRKQLRQWPKDYRVAFAAHDLSEDEIDGLATGLIELAEGEQRNNYGPCVVIR